MNIDCQWIDKNLEALFTGTLNQEHQQRAQHHIENCVSCGKEVAALNSIDPLVKRYFDSELRRVRQGSSRRIAKGRLVVVSSVALLAVCLVLVVGLRTPPPDTKPSSAVASQAVSPLPKLPDTVPSSNTTEAVVTPERAKPVDRLPNTNEQIPRAAAAPNRNAPDFMVIDPAGYARTLSDYRGYIFVLGILRTDQRDGVSDFEQLYKQFGSNRKFRFLAVSNDRQTRIPNTTFPVAYNEGSKLFGALPGDFVLLDATGSIQLRGSLVKDFESLTKTLQNEK